MSPTQSRRRTNGSINGKIDGKPRPVPTGPERPLLTTDEAEWRCSAPHCDFHTDDRIAAWAHARSPAHRHVVDPADSIEDDDSEALTGVATRATLKGKAMAGLLEEQRTAQKLAQSLLIPQGPNPEIESLRERVRQLETERVEQRRQQEFAELRAELREMNSRISAQKEDGHHNDVANVIVTKLVDRLVAAPADPIEIGGKFIHSMKEYGSAFQPNDASIALERLRAQLSIAENQRQDAKEQAAQALASKHEEALAARAQVHEIFDLGRTVVQDSLKPILQSIGDGVRERVSGRRSPARPELPDFAAMSSTQRVEVAKALEASEQRIQAAKQALVQAETAARAQDAAESKNQEKLTGGTS